MEDICSYHSSTHKAWKYGFVLVIKIGWFLQHLLLTVSLDLVQVVMQIMRWICTRKNNFMTIPFRWCNHSTFLWVLSCINWSVWVIDNLWWGGTHQDWRKFNYFLCKQFKPLNRLMTSCHESNKWKYEKFDPTISHENGWVLINNVGVANNHRVFLVDAMCYVS